MEHFIKEYTIGLREITSDYKAKTTALLNDFQNCFAQYCLEHSITGYNLAQKGLMWVVAGINIEFVGELPSWNDKINVEVWLSGIKKLRMFIDFEITDEKGAIIAKGDSCWFILDSTTRRPVPLDNIINPDWIIDRKIFDSRYKVKEIEQNSITMVNNLDFDVSSRDLDYNNHVNNLSYVDWGLMTVPELKDYKIKKYSIIFKNECFLEEKISANLYKIDNGFYFEAVKEDSTKACLLEIYAEKVKNLAIF